MGNFGLRLLWTLLSHCVVNLMRYCGSSGFDTQCSLESTAKSQGLQAEVTQVKEACKRCLEPPLNKIKGQTDRR